MNEIKNLRIYGEEIKEPVTSDNIDQLQHQATYLIGASTRGDAQKVEIPLNDQNLIELTFDDTSVWLCAPEDIEQLFPEIKINKRDGDDTYELPLSIQADVQQRGLVGNIALKMLKIFTKKGVNPVVHKLAADFESKELGNQEGLCSIQSNFQLDNSSIPDNGSACLLFIHGTASSTNGSFGQIKDDSNLWQSLQKIYGKNILAFQHRSLTKSPLQNVLDLVEALPNNADLHLVTHSRGGIAGDILNRFCTQANYGIGFSGTELDYLQKHDRTEDIRIIRAIEKIVSRKKITVSKFVRVACPASGTTLASSRLDFIFNMIFNLIGLIPGLFGNPAYIAFKNLLAAVVETKDDVNVLPGLESMNPASPFIEMLNNGMPDTDIDAPLMIIAGNSTGLSNFKRGLSVIASKLFYWGKNDFVVDTASMYNGAKRGQQKVQYFLDEGNDVSHFNYFVNPITRKALLLALQNTDGSLVPGFQWQQQVASSEEIRNAALKSLQHGAEFRDTVTGKKPIAVLLPGIMGSNLSTEGDTLWINYARFLTGGLSRLEYNEINNKNIKASSLIKTSYGNLANHLTAEGYDVVTFPFDWRLPMEQCAALLDRKLNDLIPYGQPIKLIGHSLGGVLIRDFIIYHPNTWNTLNKTKDFRLLFLGSPLGGSFRIPYVLFGLDDIIKTLSMVDLRHSKKELVDIFRNLPGLLCLLPITKDPFNDFAKTQTWTDMRSKTDDQKWPLPDAGVLQGFGNYRDKILNAQSAIDFSNAIYIAGQSRAGKFTPSGYRYNAQGKLEFLVTRAGDESVTWATGIPAAMSQAGTVYYSDVTHGELANDKTLFKPITDILKRGSTDLLRKTRPELRGEDEERVAKPSFNFDRSPETVEKVLLGLSTEEKYEQGILPVSVSISNGDLKFSSYPVLTGHFINDGIFSAEKVIDRYLDGAISKRMQLGLYPGEIGTSEILISDQGDIPRFKGAIIAGLGKQGSLSVFQLSLTVEQAVTSFLTDFNNQKVIVADPRQNNNRNLGISSLIIGCGYGGLTIESSIRAIITGVQNANKKIQQVYPENTSLINEIEFIELLHDKALGCVQALKKMEKDEDRSLQMVWKSRKIKKLLGWQERLPVDNTSDWWTRITVKQLEDEDLDENCGNRKGLRYNISTDAAREEERYIRTGKATITQLLDQLSTQNQWSPALAKTIFELLIPYDFKDQIKRQNNINWLVDKSTAAYPWELLHDSESNALPLSVNAGMIRQLATQEYRLNIKQVSGNTALVIGDPDLEGSFSQLAGAEREGRLVYNLLKDQGFDVTDDLLSKASAANILLSLFSKSYKIIHLAGHGIFNPDPNEPSGMLIGKNAYLTTAEIAQMSVVPELAFINCCHLGKMDEKAEQVMQHRYKLAANIGTQLIEIGVKAVIVAGWAVDDEAALDFTASFYQDMFEGYNFGESVKRARKKVYTSYGDRTNTWGAYQCYGDPFYSLQTKKKATTKTYDFIVPEEAEIELSNMLNRIDIGEYFSGEIQETIQAISKAVDAASIRTPEIDTLEAYLYTALNRYDLACSVFERLIGPGKAGYHVQAMEKYCNVRPKFILEQYRKAPEQSAQLLQQLENVLEDLKALQRYGQTAERWKLLGSAYKRKAMMLKGEDKLKALKEATGAYIKAFDLSGDGDRFYSLINWAAIANALVATGYESWGANGFTGKTKNNVIKLLEDDITEFENKILLAEDMDYWQLVALANLKFCQAQMQQSKDGLEEMYTAYRNVWHYAGHIGNRQAELEHLDFLADILNIQEKDLKPADIKKLEQLRNVVETVKVGLEGMKQ
jgi:CHAT domain-containing protein